MTLLLGMAHTSAAEGESPTLEMLLFLGEFADEEMEEADQWLPLDDDSNTEQDDTHE